MAARFDVGKRMGMVCAWIAVALALGTALPTAAAITLSGAPGTAQVVDAATGDPIADAVVLMYAEVVPINRPTGTQYWRSAKTGADGHFSLPAWGKPDDGVMGPDGRFTSTRKGPILWVFKPGYREHPWVEQGDPVTEAIGDSTDPIRNPAWYDGKTARLIRLPGSSVLTPGI
jgi:hypothetical protein